jgi:Putative transposase/Transposase zinc-binding domain
VPGPLHDLGDIFRRYGEDFLRTHPLGPVERKAFFALSACRTARLGGHLDVCDRCGHSRPSYNSCRNRHCPKCQSLAQARWIDARTQRLLPTHYFHVVFTLPSALRPLCRRNPARLYDLLFAAASKTLLDLGRDPGRLGATLGATCVLHTWTRELAYHPHLHCIVTGGGLAASSDQWVSARRKYLFPVRVLSALFRGKFLDGLRHLYQDGALTLDGPCAALTDPCAFDRFIDVLYRTDWVVYAKRPFGGPPHVFAYLGRYTHRVGLSNHRIQAACTDGIRFVTKGDRTITLAPAEFIRRFLLHILPHGFTKIRHYGLLSPHGIRAQLDQARQLLAAQPADVPAVVAAAPPRPQPWQKLLLYLTGFDVTRCPSCHVGVLQPRPLFPDTS